MPEVGGAEHFTELVESKIPMADTLKKLGFTDDITEPARVTEKMLIEQAGEWRSIGNKKRAELWTKIASRAGMRVGGLATLIIVSGIAGIVAAHETEHFPPEKNLFINKKKETDDDDI